jgi:hypothetical protein
MITTLLLLDDAHIAHVATFNRMRMEIKNKNIITIIKMKLADEEIFYFILCDCTAGENERDYL